MLGGNVRSRSGLRLELSLQAFEHIVNLLAPHSGEVLQLSGHQVNYEGRHHGQIHECSRSYVVAQLSPQLP